MKKITIASRKSTLAVRQVTEVMSSLPQVPYTTIPTDSYGDTHKNISLWEHEADDLFTRELDAMVLNGAVDVAIHSAKDLPFPLPQELAVIALLGGEERTDALVSKDTFSLDTLPAGSRVGTSSLRRKEYVGTVRPDVRTVSIRGTIEERLALLDEGAIAALIMATCALQRLGLDQRITEIVPCETHPLQGYLAVVARIDRADMKELFAPVDRRKEYGNVALVGYGPGDPELMTIKADKRVSQSEVIVYDDLINKSVLEKYTADKIYVGKRKGHHSKTQDEINVLLYELARSGKKVVRLKNGDPFIFGRGGEEATYLQKRFIPVEVIPGVTAAIAAAAVSGIPLTQRGIAGTVAFCSAHPLETMPVPQVDTLVYYMGASVLSELVQKVIHAGWPLDTPIVLIADATLPAQRVTVSSLSEVQKSIRTYASPLLIIIGAVVAGRQILTEIQREKKTVVTGTHPELYQSFGSIVHQPAIAIHPLAAYEEADTILAESAAYDWIIFTSTHTVRFFFERMTARGKDVRHLATCRIAAIGKTTAWALEKHGIIADLFPQRTESSRGLVKIFREKGITNQKILIPRSACALPLLSEGLRALGNTVTTVTLYKNTPVHHQQPIPLNTVARVIFGSPSCVRNFKKTYKNIPSHITCYSRGEETRKAIQEYFHHATIKNV